MAWEPDDGFRVPCDGADIDVFEGMFRGIARALFFWVRSIKPASFWCVNTAGIPRCEIDLRVWRHDDVKTRRRFPILGRGTS
jgi:hypothetical protein